MRALVTWLAIAVVLGVALLAARLHTSGLDDPDLAMQRPGYLDAVGPQSAAPLVTGSIPASGHIAVVFFVRPAQQKPLLAALSRPHALPSDVDTVVVGGPANLSETAVATVTDQDGTLAEGYDMPEPRDSGYPVGYAVVGPNGLIRYRTLDPAVATRLGEVRTMLRGLK